MSFFLTDQIRVQNAASDVVERFELNLAVQGLVADINRTQGFRVFGWFEPAFDDQGTAIEHNKFHNCSMEPARPITAAQMAMQYNGSAPELACVFSTIEDEGLSNGDGLGPGETQDEDIFRKFYSTAITFFKHAELTWFPNFVNLQLCRFCRKPPTQSEDANSFTNVSSVSFSGKFHFLHLVAS